MKTKIIPFDLETAKKIQSGEVEGRIVTNHDMVVTLVDAQYGFDEEYWIPIIWHWATEHNELILYNSKGECRNSHKDCYLHIELPEEAPKHEFKPFDKVLVRPVNTWKATFYSHLYSINGDYSLHVTTDGQCYANDQIIPYEGHEHLVGTTDKPKEE